MRRCLPALVLLAGLVWLGPTPSAEAQGCVAYNPPFQGYLYGACYSYPFNGYSFPVNVPFGGNALSFGFPTLNTFDLPSNTPINTLTNSPVTSFSFGFPFQGYPPYTGFDNLAGGGGPGGGGAGSGGVGGLAYQGFAFPFSGYPFHAGASITYNGYLFPIYGFPGSVGYNAGARRGFNPYATPDAYLKTLDAVALPDGGYQLHWTTGTTFSGTSHEIFQCPESDTPLVACRSVGIVNAETRTFGPVPGGFTYVVRTSGYGGNTGTVSWGGGLEAGSSRLPLPLAPAAGPLPVVPPPGPPPVAPPPGPLGPPRP
jgi:hypothetical protein